MQHRWRSYSWSKAQLLRQISLAESSLGQIAGRFLRDVDLGLPLDEPTRAAHSYLGLTAAEVQSAFGEFIRPESLVQVTQGPAPR